MSRKDEKPKKALKRIPTGVRRLDYILKGGFIKGGIYTISGPPGSGKTIFGNQVSFNHIKNDSGRCLYLTLLAESHAKMLTHLETLEFYDPGYVDRELKYLSGFQVLKDVGLAGLLTLIRKTVKDHKASLLIIDGIQIVPRYAHKSFSYDEFLHALQAYMSILECTMILISPSNRAGTDDVENVIVDGIIEMSYHLVGPRAVRELTVHKFRGTDYLIGKHETIITGKGLQIHPRTEVQFDTPEDYAQEKRLIKAFGNEALDKMLDGGLLSGTTTVLLGSPGTGKTILGLSFLVEGAKRGERGVYFGFSEPTPRLISKAESIGIPLRTYFEKGLIDIIWQPPLEHCLDALAEKLLEKIKEEEKRGSRLFIDGAEGFREAAIYEERMPKFLSALTHELRMMNMTTLITEELDLFAQDLKLPHPELTTTSEGVILLRQVETKSKMQRLISILKMRENAYDPSVREFKIAQGGIIISELPKDKEVGS